MLKAKPCPQNGAPMTADVAKGVWRCPVADCYKQHEKSKGARFGLPAGCASLNEGVDYTESMTGAEIMAATGAKELFDA